MRSRVYSRLMGDMLVKLYDLPAIQGAAFSDPEIRFVRALVVDKPQICDFVRRTFGNEGWVAECEVALGQQPSTCFIAVRQGEVIGFSCYDATAKGMLGPLGVKEEFRGKGIAAALIRQCLEAMRHAGYVYAAIGWVGSEAFYARVCNAVPIPDSSPSVYARMIHPPGGD